MIWSCLDGLHTNMCTKYSGNDMYDSFNKKLLLHKNVS